MSTPRTLALAANVLRSDVETSRGTFAALTAEPHGSSLPHGNVLLLPGFTGSKEDFAALLPLLAAAGWSSAAVDQRGQFESPGAPQSDFTLSGFAADAHELAESRFGTADRVHLVGHSFGGLVSAVAAITGPDRWASLTLLCSGPGGFTGEQRNDPLAAAAALERETLEQVYLLKQQRDRQRGRPAASAEIEGWLRKRFLASSSGSLAAIARHLADAPDLMPRLARLQLPVHVVRGERDDAWPHATQDRLAAALGTSVVVIAGAAHSPAWEQPEETRDALVRLWLS